MDRLKRRDFIQAAAALLAAVLAPVPKMLPRESHTSACPRAYSRTINTYVQAQSAKMLALDIETDLEPGNYVARTKSVFVVADYAGHELRIVAQLIKENGVRIDWAYIEKLRGMT